MKGLYLDKYLCQEIEGFIFRKLIFGVGIYMNITVHATPSYMHPLLEVDNKPFASNIMKSIFELLVSYIYNLVTTSIASNIRSISLLFRFDFCGHHHFFKT